MKKLILIAAVALFSLGVSAQGYNTKLRVVPQTNTLPKVEVNEFNKTVMKNFRPKTTTRTVNGIPEGEQREYFMLGINNVSGISGYWQRANKHTVVFGEGDRIYLPLMIWDDILTPEGSAIYVEGTIRPTTQEGISEISIDNNQVVGQTTVNNVPVNLFINAVNNDTQGSPANIPATLYYDQAAEVIYFNSNEAATPFMLGLYVTYQGQSILQAMWQDPTYYPINETFFSQPVNREMSYSEDLPEGSEMRTTTVEDYPTPYLSGHFMRGVFPAYPDVWVVMSNPRNSADLVIGAQYLTPTDLFVIGDEELRQISSTRNTTLTYDATADTYTQAADDYNYSILYSDSQGGIVYSNKYHGLVLGPATPTGISGVETSTDKEAVSTEYYDLSGRRISAADKGVSIKVEKYADGTSKAVKVLK